MNFHQLQVAYDVNEDRILMRISFKTEAQIPQEYRAWLTRRMVRNLWPYVVRAMETRVVLEQPGAAHVKSDIVEMEYQATLSEFAASGNFEQPYEAQDYEFPMGESPLLVTRADFTILKDQPVRINFLPSSGKGFEIGLPPKLWHGFCSMLQAAVASANWDYVLNLPGNASAEAGERVLN